MDTAGIILLIVMVFIIFLCYEINVNNIRKLIVIFMAYPIYIMCQYPAPLRENYTFMDQTPMRRIW